MTQQYRLAKAEYLAATGLNGVTRSKRPTKALTCPRHGEPYVLRPGTTRCPKGRKANRNCI